LASYEYTIVFRSTSKHANADPTSWLPLPDKPASTPVPAQLVLLIEKLGEVPITYFSKNKCKLDKEGPWSLTVYTVEMAKWS